MIIIIMLPHPRDKNSVGIPNIPLQVRWPFSSPFISCASSCFFIFHHTYFPLALYWLESNRRDKKGYISSCPSTPIIIKFTTVFNGKYTCCSPETSIASILKSENKEVQPTPIRLKNNNYWNKQKCFCKQKRKMFVFFPELFPRNKLSQNSYVHACTFVWQRQYNKSPISQQQRYNYSISNIIKTANFPFDNNWISVSRFSLTIPRKSEHQQIKYNNQTILTDTR